MNEQPMDQQAVDKDSTDAESDRTAVPDASDPLSVLERRWEAMAGKIRDLRNENGNLKEQMAERDERIARLDAESTRLNERLAVMNEEKKRTISRIENLLAHFDDLGQ